MAATSVAMYRGTVPLVNGPIYTVPAGKTGIITDIWIANPTTTADQVYLRLDGVPLMNVPIPANSVVQFGLKQVVTAGKILMAYSLQARAEAHISGVEI